MDQVTIEQDPEIMAELRDDDAARDKAAMDEALKAPIYYDGDKYWVQLPTGRWKPNKKDDMIGDLMFGYKVGKAHRAHEVLHHVRRERYVVGTFPYLHRKQLVIEESAGPTLNTSYRKLVQPAAQDGPFPWIEDYINNSWDTKVPEQRDIYLSWLQRFYGSAYDGNLKAGHAIIIAGDTDIGKTLFSRRVVGAALGGYTDAGSILLGKTQFNKEAAEVAHWAVDDARANSTWEKHEQFSEALKRFVANPQMSYHPKFKDSQLVEWRGRICVTCNLDARSLSILPDMDGSIRDKVSLFRCRDNWRPQFKDIEEVVKGELPFFLRWLLAWKSPCKVTNERFGYDSYQHPELLGSSFHASAAGVLKEMLPYAIKHSYINDEKAKEKWMSSTEILALLDTPGLRKESKFQSSSSVGMALSSLWEAHVKAPCHGDRVLNRRVLDGIRLYLINLEVT